MEKFAAMTDLNEYECEMLDAMLEAFGIPDSLTREQLLELFDNDEAAAFAMVHALIREDLVAGTGRQSEYDLPEKLVLKPKGEKFLKEGGFSARYQREQQRPQEVGGTLAKLQQQNMRLQNEKLANQTELNALKKRMSARQARLYFMWVLVIVALIVGYMLGHMRK